jgi:hypothetical protein
MMAGCGSDTASEEVRERFAEVGVTDEEGASILADGGVGDVIGVVVGGKADEDEARGLSEETSGWWWTLLVAEGAANEASGWCVDASVGCWTEPLASCF